MGTSMKKKSDSIYHPPSGSSYPGKVEANPYVFYPPDEIRKLLKTEKDEEKLVKMKSALKQWERQYVYPGFPFKMAQRIRLLAQDLIKKSEIVGPADNIPYYQEAETPEGFESVMKGIKDQNPDNYDMKREDYARQGERPVPDQSFNRGDMSAPTEGIPEINYDGGSSGPDPAGLEYEPVGGPLDEIDGGKI